MIPILYGSQTGNGIHLSKILSKKIPGSFVSSVDNLNILNINDFQFIIFIVSTHGDGQCPFNMAKFFKILTTQNVKLFSFKCAILGLGDSSYSKYNYCARILSERIKMLGADLICFELANTQDLNGIYDGYRAFETKVLGYVQDINPTATVDAERLKETLKDTRLGARVVKNERLTPLDYENQIYEITLEIPSYTDFYPGDCISIQPINTINLKIIFDFDDDQISYLTKTVDFFSTVQQTHFKELASFTDSKIHREKLLEIYDDYDLYHEYVVVPRRNIIEIIEDFDLKIPFEFIKDLNEIYPRYFSCTKVNDQYKILYNVIEYQTYLNKKRYGICTQYLTTLRENDQIEVGITRSNLFFDDKKLLFFSTGTGVTLPRSAVHFFKDKEIKIFYGFRHKEKDQLCKNEFGEVEIHYASSKDDKKYIMDLYRKHPVENIDEWLVFVSGNCRLNKEISNLMKEVHSKDVVFQSETW